MHAHPTTTRMSATEALGVLNEIRGDQLVVTTMGATREWSRLSQSPLDFHYLPSAMGHAPMIGLGLALAQPQREVIVLNGDGSLLMSLGCLVTIKASGATNLTVVVLDNGVYEVTGGQRTAGALVDVNFADVARGARFPTVASFEDCETWREAAVELLQAPGPRFIALRVAPVMSDYVPKLSETMRERIERFRGALNA